MNSLSRSASLFTLDNVQPWQQTSKSKMVVNGYYRAGIPESQRIHLLHGTGFSAMTLAAMASQLPSAYNIWLTDVPGHGGSTQPTKKMPNWQKMADTVVHALYQQADVKNQGPLIGVGHSMGGVLTLLAANKYPDLFSRIILLDPVLFQTEMIIAQQLMRLTGTWKHRSMVKAVSNRTHQWPDLNAMQENIADKAFYRNWHPQVISDYCQYSSEQFSNGVQLSCSPAWEASIFGSYPKGLWQAVRKVQCPVDILMAKSTYFFIPSAVKRAAKKNKRIQWQTFGDKHCFPMEQPTETANIIATLLNNPSASAI